MDKKTIGIIILLIIIILIIIIGIVIYYKNKNKISQEPKNPSIEFKTGLNVSGIKVV